MEAAAVTRLTTLSHGAGCACKIGPGELDDILRLLPRRDDTALLVGAETRDDAGVYRLGDDVAIVQTVDFFTPIVDDPYDFGRVAAANALSDVYAMGARPVTALNLVAFSLERLGAAVLAEILRGGAEVAASAGVAIVGGHSIDDPEPKYGMAVTGVVHPDRVVRNSTARPGDALFLSKPIGSGAVTTGAKRGIASPATVRGCVAVMTELNASASEAAIAAGASAMTDVTGFGLLGHLREMTVASGVSARIDAAAVPVLEGALELMEAGAQSGGSRRNREWVEPHVSFGSDVPPALQNLLCDAMTSGGLLVAVPPDQVMEQATRIGHLEDGAPGEITVV